MTATILVVDDSMMVRQEVGSVLGGAGFNVVEAHDGLDAMAKLDAAPDAKLIVLDVNMPNMNGIEFLEKLRAREGRAVPVVMLTTEGQPKLMQQAKALGAKGWIIKPFKPQMLVAAVQKLTGS